MKKLLTTLLASSLLLCSGLAFAQDPVRVGSKQFTENVVLAKIIITALENADIPTADQTPLGATDVNRAALVNGEIDVYPEYTGTAISNFLVNEGADVPEGVPDPYYGGEDGFAHVLDLVERGADAWLARLRASPEAVDAPPIRG